MRSAKILSYIMLLLAEGIAILKDTYFYSMQTVGNISWINCIEYRLADVQLLCIYSS